MDGAERRSSVGSASNAQPDCAQLLNAWLIPLAFRRAVRTCPSAASPCACSLPGCHEPLSAGLFSVRVIAVKS
jgi:hypothetical protein